MQRSNRVRILAPLAALALVASACGGGGAATDAPADGSSTGPIGEGRTLVVTNWQDYGTDIDWAVAAFEEATGATVVHQYFNSEEELLALMREGGGAVDVALPNIAYLQQAIAEELVVPIDLARLDNADELSADLLAQDDLRSGDALYGVPWMWGSTALAYNTDAFPEGIDSWAALWDPANAGQVAFFDDPATAVMTTALFLGQDPLDPDLDAVKAKLIELKGNTQLYWSSADDWQRGFSTGAITLGNLWSGLAGTQLGAGDPIAYVVPEEGAVGWLDTLTIVKGSENEDLAYAFIDWMISAEFQERWANDVERSSPAPANATVHAKLDPDVAGRVQSDPAALSTLALMGSIPPETLSAWTELWQEVKAS